VLAVSVTITGRYISSINSYCDNNGGYICGINRYYDKNDKNGEVYMQC